MGIVIATLRVLRALWLFSSLLKVSKIILGTGSGPKFNKIDNPWTCELTVFKTTGDILRRD